MVIRFGQIELDEQRFLLQRDGVRLRIRPKVFDLLVHLVRHRQRVVLREELVMALWGTTAVGLGSLSGLVNELRHVLGEAGRGPSSIRTVHARGYQFVADVEPHDVAGGLGDHEEAIETGLGRFSAARGAIRASSARVVSAGARAVIVVADPGTSCSSLLNQTTADLSQAGFEIHPLRGATHGQSHPSAFVDRLVDELAEHYGIVNIRSLIPARARELLERIGGTRANSTSSARPRDPLASRQYDEQLSRSTAQLLCELAAKRPLALVLDEGRSAADEMGRALLPLLRLLGRARVLFVCRVGTDGKDPAPEIDERAELGIEYVRLPAPDRSQLNEMLRSRGVPALPTVLADALMAHVRADEAILDSVVGCWLRGEVGRDEPGAVGSAPPNIERRMKRVEPDTLTRRSPSRTA